MAPTLQNSIIHGMRMETSRWSVRMRASVRTPQAVTLYATVPEHVWGLFTNF